MPTDSLDAATKAYADAISAEAGGVNTVSGGAGLFPDGPSVGNVALSVNVDESTIGIVDDTLRVLDSGIGTAQIADGSIRSEDIGTGEILAGNIATGAVGSEELATIPTVTPGSYANASITVDEDGRITAASDGEVAGIGGTGNANYIPKFSDDHNITNSTIYETSDGRIGIGTASIDATAGLELSGTGKGLLIYRMSETEREAITNPATGLLIYNTDSNCFNMFNGTTWKQSCFDCAFTPSVASSNSPICEGETLELYASTVTDATYHWTGPNSFDSDLQNPTITNVTTSASGVYYLTTTKEGCTSEPTNTNVTINTAPATPSAIDGPSEVCEGATGVSYSIAPVPGANYYNWSVPSGASITSGQGNTNILMDFGSNSGDISVTATNTTNDCGSSAPNSKTVTVHSLPTSTFTPTEALVGINTTFTPTVSGASYNWSFSSGSPSSSTEENPSVSWSSAGTYDVTLTVTDANGCTSTTTTPVTVSIPISCLDIKNTVSDATDGVYTIDPDSSGSVAPFDIYCDMTTDGGGWTLLIQTADDGNLTFGGHSTYLTTDALINETHTALDYTVDAKYESYNSVNGNQYMYKIYKTGHTGVCYMAVENLANPFDNTLQAVNNGGVGNQGDIQELSFSNIGIDMAAGDGTCSSGSCFNFYNTYSQMDGNCVSREGVLGGWRGGCNNEGGHGGLGHESNGGDIYFDDSSSPDRWDTDYTDCPWSIGDASDLYGSLWIR